MLGRALCVGLLMLASLPANRPLPPHGWRFPTTTELSEEWRDESPHRYASFTADFDGDRIKDRAMLLVSANGEAAAVVVVFGGPAGKTMVVENLEDPRWLEVMGIDMVTPGKYETACGKGHWECGADEPSLLSLRRAAISVFKIESASSFYFFDKKTGAFRSVAISD